MAVITLPSTTRWQEVRFVPSIKPKPRFTSPTSLLAQTFVWDGESFAFSFQLPPLIKATALTWIKALRDLEIADNTFTADMSDYMSTDVSDRATFSMRVVTGSAQCRRRLDGMYEISFQAEKAQ